MSAKSFIARTLIVLGVAAVISAPTAAGGGEKTAWYLVAGGAFVPQDGGAPHVLTMLTAIILPATCTFAFSDQLENATGAAAHLIAPRYGSRKGWAAAICATTGLRPAAAMLCASLCCLFLPLCMDSGYGYDSLAAMLPAAGLLALQQSVIALLTNTLSRRLSGTEACAAVLSAHFVALAGVALAPSAWANLLAPLVPSAQAAALAWSAVLDSAALAPERSAIYLTAMFAATLLLSIKSVSAKELM